MKTTYIRWLGAFAGRKIPLRETISFEMGRADEAACEPLQKRDHKLVSFIAAPGQVGLVLDSRSIFREFKEDCWSYYGQDDKKSRQARKDQNPTALYASRAHSNCWHREAWCHMNNAVVGIVVYGGIAEMTAEKRNVVISSAKKYSLPVFTLTRKGELREEHV